MFWHLATLRVDLAESDSGFGQSSLPPRSLSTKGGSLAKSRGEPPEKEKALEEAEFGVVSKLKCPVLLASEMSGFWFSVFHLYTQ